MTGAKILKTFLIVSGTASITAITLVVGFLVWLDRVWTEEKCFVRTSPNFRAIVSGEPAISAKLYMVGMEEMRFLLVLTAKTSKEPEAYYIDATGQEIGSPDFGVYRPLWKGALVPWLACEGFPHEGTVAAEWHWINNNEDLRIRVKGLQYPSTPNRGPVPGMVELAYGREIVLVHLPRRRLPTGPYTEARIPVSAIAYIDR